MYKNALKTILSKENYERIENERNGMFLKKLLSLYHNKFKRNKEIYNKAFPLILKREQLIKREVEILEKLLRRGELVIQKNSPSTY